MTNDAWNARKVGLNLQSLLLADYGWANYATTIVSREDAARTPGDRARVRARLARGLEGIPRRSARPRSAIKKDSPQMEVELMEFSHGEMKRLGLIDSGDAAGGRSAS